jgi:hypothetical protein
MKKSKIKRCILEGNEKFQKRKWAYLSPNVMGKVVFKPLQPTDLILAKPPTFTESWAL